MSGTAVQAKAEILLAEHDLCDHCLGRQFARLGHGLENWERGLIIRDHMADDDDLDEDSFVRDAIPDEEPRRGTCDVCGGLFAKQDHFADRVLNALGRYDFDTFMVGTRPPGDVVQAEEDLWGEVGLDWVEPLKGEFNRLMGKRIEDATDAVFDAERPDVNPIIDIANDRVELQINSLCIYGRYNKEARNLPQTKWPCTECRGSGCDACDWTGKQYPESVQELIAAPVVRATKALDTKFHGAGREDVDVRCLGRREFVLEVLEPRDRDVDLAELQAEINRENEGKIEVFDLEVVDKDMVEAVKSRRADKRYRAIVSFDEPVSDEALDRLTELVGTVEQDTPERVEHRRADKTRERDVTDVTWERLDDDRIELEIEAEAGTYIKELISSDDDRTRPSVAGLLGTGAMCERLDVIAIRS